VADRVTRIFEETFAEGTPNARVTRIFEETFAEGTPNARVTRIFQEIFADPGNDPGFINDEAFFQPQAVYTQTFSPPLLSDDALFTPVWELTVFPPLLSDEELFTPVVPRSTPHSVFT